MRIFQGQAHLTICIPASFEDLVDDGGRKVCSRTQSSLYNLAGCWNNDVQSISTLGSDCRRTRSINGALDRSEEKNVSFTQHDTKLFCKRISCYFKPRKSYINNFTCSTIGFMENASVDVGVITRTKQGNGRRIAHSSPCKSSTI